jgi:hypothetical protein
MSASANPRLPPKPLFTFAAHAIALTLLIGYWPTLRHAYPALFHAHANALFALLEVPGVHFAPGAATDTTLVVAAPRAGEGAAWESSFGVARIGYAPSAALVAMLLATPLAPLRRALAAAIGLALVDLFTLARIGVEVAYLLQRSNEPDASPHGAIAVLLGIGSESLTATIPSAAFVLVCWVLLANPRRTIDLSAARAWIGLPAR